MGAQIDRIEAAVLSLTDAFSGMQRQVSTLEQAKRTGADPEAAAATAPEGEKPPFYITTPIYYVNGLPHIGHAYTTLACDVLARFKRLDGHEVKFLTGTDEHGQKVEQSATAAGETPLAFADRVSGIFRTLLGTYDFSNDDFIRTTEGRHREAAQALWQKLLAAGMLVPLVFIMVIFVLLIDHGMIDAWFSSTLIAIVLSAWVYEPAEMAARYFCCSSCCAHAPCSCQ